MTRESRLIRHDSKDLLNSKRTPFLPVRALGKCDSDKRLADGDERAFVKSTGVGNTWPPMNRQTSSNINLSRNSLFMQVVTSLERKIDEKLRSQTGRISINKTAQWERLMPGAQGALATDTRIPRNPGKPDKPATSRPSIKSVFGRVSASIWRNSEVKNDFFISSALRRKGTN
jgi:hypothetical protein